MAGNTEIKASDLFIKCLEEEDVEYVFGVPGEENLDFLDSLSRSKSIKLILTRHEQGAGFMAATYGRHTGKTGVCLATLGPGATNFVTAAAYATLGGMPMLMITGQKPIKKSKQGRFQILDVVAMMTPITKYAHQMASADNIPSRVREAFRIAEEEKPGAAHIELPEDIADEHTDSRPLERSIVRRPTADVKSVRQAVEALEKAKRPVLVIGAGANRTMTSRMLNQFVDKTGIPFLTSQLGKGVLDERHPKFLGCAALSAGDFVHRAIEDADCIVNIGHDVIEKPPFFMKNDGASTVPGRLRDPHLHQDGGGRSRLLPPYRGDRRYRQRHLADQGGHHALRKLEVRSHAGLSQGRDSIIPVQAGRRRALPHLPAASGASRCAARMPDDGIICLDNGVYKIWFARGYTGVPAQHRAAG